MAGVQDHTSCHRPGPKSPEMVGPREITLKLLWKYLYLKASGQDIAKRTPELPHGMGFMSRASLVKGAFLRWVGMRHSQSITPLHHSPDSVRRTLGCPSITPLANSPKPMGCHHAKLRGLLDPSFSYIV